VAFGLIIYLVTISVGWKVSIDPHVDYPMGRNRGIVVAKLTRAFRAKWSAPI